MLNKNKIEFLIIGIIIAFGALLAENIFNVLFSIRIDDTLNRLTFPLIIYAVIEESLKLAVLDKKKSATNAFSNSFFLGAGFALTEIFHRYLINSSLPSNDFAPLFGILIIHIATSVLIAYLLRKKTPVLLAILPPLLVHVFYNCLIIYEFDYFLILIFLFLLIISILYAYLGLKNQYAGNLPNN